MTVVTDFPAGFSGLSRTEIESFMREHALASSDDLIATLTGIATSAHTGRVYSSVRVARRDAVRHLQAIESTAQSSRDSLMRMCRLRTLGYLMLRKHLLAVGS